ncbi:B12-binding domain-containing radical SAM protein [Marilutibacter chinensis]|uniref:B12-binding domain-containing radical SAM protein n=1 Tax=Marilutibacter chinensis TaxID=2912247 RepID=A0ABS9HZE1_9GAMM|nr:radical SAM protein [Lysobacter chinensis]MCF7223752.1 B12-binding domain-containing radical SAM protein [Lysobacter chinensis]
MVEIAAEQKIVRARCKSPRFLLLYPPLQFAQNEVAKPDGSLSLAYLAGALRDAGYEVSVLDCTVGADGSPLEDSFFNVTVQPNGLRRIGMPAEAILRAIEDYDVIGLTSIFTPQTTPCLDLIAQIRNCYPNKLILAGGVNARSMRRRFFAAGADLIAISEAETTIVRIAEALQGRVPLSAVPGIMFLDQDGRERSNPVGQVLQNLDELPMPAWDMLPMQQYWAISRPHGGNFPEGQTIRYASLQTSRGCPFRCEYCHISREQSGSEYGHVGAFRMKSVDRTYREFEALKSIGVEYIFIEDDSLFAKKRRALDIFRMVRDLGFKLLDVNGINLCHLHRGRQGTQEQQVDHELIDVLAEAGFTALALPFESASQRILDRYASAKWRIADTNTAKLIRAFNDRGIRVSGNYMIGYPDESIDEIFDTITMAKRNVEEGLDYALFFAVVPFPGSALFEMAVRDGHIDRDFDPDELRWTKSIMRRLKVDTSTLEHLRQLAWMLVNRSEYVSYKRGMILPV